jgi:purine-binding chemotaxis protein CheW
MANSILSKDFPSNKALQHYFDDLTSSGSELLESAWADKPLKSEVILEANESASQSKLVQANRLLAKANAVEMFFADAIEQNETVNDSLVPIITDGLHQNTEKNQIDSKENDANADITNTSDTIVRKTRDVSISLKNSLSTSFQVLLCDINNLTIAIPLVELGGIYKLTKISPIAKQPFWCKGIFIKGDDKYTCIDAAAWLMPSGQLGTKPSAQEYKFAVQLGKSEYVLCCNGISTTLEISKDEVKWRNNMQVQPWLAGLIKDKMCALVDGAQMVREVLK